jgi:hypothetical protein
MTKLSCERLHCKRRALERFGLRLNRKDLINMVTLIKRGEGKFLKRRSNRVTLWKINYKDNDMIAVYDKLRNNIITVMKGDI